MRVNLRRGDKVLQWDMRGSDRNVLIKSQTAESTHGLKIIYLEIYITAGTPLFCNLGMACFSLSHHVGFPSAGSYHTVITATYCLFDALWPTACPLCHFSHEWREWLTASLISGVDPLCLHTWAPLSFELLFKWTQNWSGLYHITAEKIECCVWLKSYWNEMKHIFHNGVVLKILELIGLKMSPTLSMLACFRVFCSVLWMWRLTWRRIHNHHPPLYFAFASVFALDSEQCPWDSLALLQSAFLY